MRLPKIIPPEELPSSVQVRTFNGDLVTVERPQMNGDAIAPIFWTAFLVLAILVGVSKFYADGGTPPFGLPALSPLARLISSATPRCDPWIDCGVQFVLVIYTGFAAVLGLLWLLWQVQLMRYAAKVEDETT